MTFDLKAETQKLADALEGLRLAGLTMSSEPAMRLIAAKLVAAAVCLDSHPPPKPDRRPKLTERQRELLDMVVEYASAHGYPPTLRDIGQHMGISSTNGVNDHLKALEKKGYIVRKELKSRSIRVINWPTQGAERTES
jgi:biotin operon repressor